MPAGGLRTRADRGAAAYFGLSTQDNKPHSLLAHDLAENSQEVQP